MFQTNIITIFKISYYLSTHKSKKLFLNPIDAFKILKIQSLLKHISNFLTKRASGLFSSFRNFDVLM